MSLNPYTERSSTNPVPQLLFNVASGIHPQYPRRPTSSFERFENSSYSKLLQSTIKREWEERGPDGLRSSNSGSSNDTTPSMTFCENVATSVLQGLSPAERVQIEKEVDSGWNHAREEYDQRVADMYGFLNADEFLRTAPDILNSILSALEIMTGLKFVLWTGGPVDAGLSFISVSGDMARDDSPMIVPYDQAIPYGLTANSWMENRNSTFINRCVESMSTNCGRSRRLAPSGFDHTILEDSQHDNPVPADKDTPMPTREPKTQTQRRDDSPRNEPNSSGPHVMLAHSVNKYCAQESSRPRPSSNAPPTVNITKRSNPSSMKSNTKETTPTARDLQRRKKRKNFFDTQTDWSRPMVPLSTHTTLQPSPSGTSRSSSIARDSLSNVHNLEHTYTEEPPSPTGQLFSQKDVLIVPPPPAQLARSPHHKRRRISEATPCPAPLQAVLEKIPSSAEWLPRALQNILQRDIGAEYYYLVLLLIEVEYLHGFDEKRGSRLPSVGRPAEVGKWVATGRGRTTIKVDDVRTYSEGWWKWWKSLQPSWRNVDKAGKPVMTLPSSRAENWHCLLISGPNGLLGVVASVYWWGCATLGPEQSLEGLEDWKLAITDCTWVMSQLITTLRSGQMGTQILDDTIAK